MNSYEMYLLPISKILTIGFHNNKNIVERVEVTSNIKERTTMKKKFLSIHLGKFEMVSIILEINNDYSIEKR